MDYINQLFSLSNETSLITGSSQGIGFALAKGLARAGSKIILNGRNVDKLIVAQEKLKEQDIDASYLAFDVTNHQKTFEAIDHYEKNYGKISIVINNAGMQHRDKLENFSADIFNQMLQTNIASIFNVSQAASKFMISRGFGKIINIASVQSMLARPEIAPYTATKGAVTNLTKGMATDWAKHGLQINAIAPGYFKTPMNKALYENKEFSDWLANETPAHRWGEVEELIGACIFLASKSSSFVNGTTIYVDGGITACI